MNWRFWIKEQKFEAFVGYFGGVDQNGTELMLRALNMANALGLKGMKIETIERRESFTGDPTLTSIWFIGTEKK